MAVLEGVPGGGGGGKTEGGVRGYAVLVLVWPFPSPRNGVDTQKIPVAAHLGRHALGACCR